MGEVLVIGHRNPDTDAICSAIGYAEFKRRTGMPQAVAARCGDTNDRIDFVLQTFKAPPPRFVADVTPRVRDVMQANVISVSPEATVAEALAIMDERGIRVVPVLNDDRTCRGLVSLTKMGRFFFPTPNPAFDSRRIFASVRNLARTLSGQLVHAREPDHEEELVLMIGAMSVESFEQRLAKAPRERMVVVVGDRQEIQKVAIREGVRVIVVTGGLSVKAEVLDEARQRGVSVILSPHDSATTAMLSRASILATHVIHERFVVVREDEPLEQARPIAIESNFHAFPVLDANKRTVGMVTKSDFLKRVERQLILVDHNELSQAVQGADEVEILEVVDHHRIGLSTSQPILFRNEPVGSTSTIVAHCFLQQNLEIPQSIAGLLLAGLISDTLNLTSPTTTERDSQILAVLEKRAEVSAREFTERLFASGSVLITKPAGQAITVDCKEYLEQGRRFTVAQIEEIGFDQFWKRQAEVSAALEAQRRSQGCFFSSVLVTDVVSQLSLLLLAGPDHLLRRIDYPEVQPGVYELKGVVSRKKQLLPYLLHILQQIG